MDKRWSYQWFAMPLCSCDITVLSVSMLPGIRHKAIEYWKTVDLNCNLNSYKSPLLHYSDIIMSAMVPQFTSLTIVYSSVYSGADQRKYQSSASLAFMRGIHRWPVNKSRWGGALMFSLICTWTRRWKSLLCEHRAALLAFWQHGRPLRFPRRE